MKKIETIVKPFKLDKICDELNRIGVQGMMVTEVKIFSGQELHKEFYRGATYVVDYVPEIKIEMIVPDKCMDAVVDLVKRHAMTYSSKKRKIFVFDVKDAVRIRTGQQGNEAIS